MGGLATGVASSFSLVAIRIGSGRRHQIRAHTGHIGHPTVSDGRYTTEETFREDQAWCNRNFLHRFSLSFNSTGSQSAVCELPEDLCDALWQLRPLDMESAKTMDQWQSIETFSALTWDEMPLLENEVHESRARRSFWCPYSIYLCSASQSHIQWLWTVIPPYIKIEICGLHKCLAPKCCAIVA